MEPSNEESALLTPLQEVDTRYMSRIVEVLTRKANENANGWTKLGLLANVNEEAGTRLMYNMVVWRGESWDDWLPDLEIETVSRAIARWREGAGNIGEAPLWTSMFLGVTAQDHARWSPGYGEGFGQWKIHTDRPNRPVVEEALRGL